ncbi:MAG: ATP synthase F1 subunit epsilon [Rickettsiales bacterium]|nr:ATP synthase F1 subunit epsilon [Rickettsiales bacterium]
MKLQLITPEKTLFDGEAEYIAVPGAEGEFGVMDGHAPVIATLKEGTVAIELSGGEKKEFQVSGGVAEVLPERCTLLVEAAS